MILETKYASGKNTVRYKKNSGYSNHRELFDDLKDFQQQRDDNNDYSLQVVSPPAGYNLVFEDTFSGNSLDLNKWKMGLPFGSFYTDPDEHGFYFPEDGKLDPNTKVVSVSGGRLNLDCTWYPKTYNVDHLTGIDQERKQELLSNCNPNIAQVYKKTQYDGFTINYGGGAVHSTDSWHYGWFEAIIKCPANKHMWTHLGLHGVDFAPPEIHIVDHKSLDSATIIQPLPNIFHGAVSPFSPQWGTEQLGWFAPNLEYTMHLFKPKRMNLFAGPDRLVQYVCHWTPYGIAIYYDSILYRYYTAEVLNSLYNNNLNFTNVYFQIANGVTDCYSEGNNFGDDHPFQTARLEVDSVRVFQQ